MDNEYEKQWAEGEEVSPISDAVLKAKRKDHEVAKTDDENEFAKAFAEQPDVEVKKPKSEKDKS